MSYIVTGGAGFIGSNLVHGLNRAGITDILVVDNLADPRKLVNLHGARFIDYMDKREFRRAMQQRAVGLSKVEAVFHQGACSNTLVDDGVYMMDNNFTYSKEVLDYAMEKGASLVYASTAAVYGLSGPGHFTPTLENEIPLNVYGFSKLVFDHYVRHLFATRTIDTTVVGLRYFNVYGPREQHKDRMASVIHHFTKQIKESGKVRLFEGSGGYGNGEQRRDFVFVQDLVRLNLFFAKAGPFRNEAPKTYHAIANAGSGQSRSFNEVVAALMKIHGEVPVEFIPFPQDLNNRYQHFTEADLSGLRAAGCDLPMTVLEEGVRQTFIPA
ncbi:MULTISPECIES: ADP-glyceromanno-heptose 6-epimerase [Acidobacterium]|uniref:ADP-L-glycero-D-manno-heptose-6-epimerase n=1 Tax=Acidobacterium capsulatum (strain ATCC 51196 / DSM 11244 / BCRC 80197 / JCM 7670 / NBRC 15755 / NCIMB 13165 / 161) TaxID=240015 RepID=C1F286_ACIC5|nr:MULTISPECIES: ADP-glyceromanno-heptose 6-epimerase [Acidobacterium]ACO32965.1 ADP-L-glycero-D-manno-heptose-6-epimerase [Acidobacterium capsulatum ATCC 51196]